MIDYLKIFQWVGTISDLSIICPVVIIIYYRKYFTTSLENKLLGVFVFTLFFKTISTVMASDIFHQRNIFLYNWFDQICCLIIATIYFNWFQSKMARYSIAIGSAVCLLIAFSRPNTFFDVRTIELNGFSMVMWGIGVLLAVLSFFYALIQRLDAPRLLRYPMFWLSAGLLLYFSATIFSYIYSEFTFNNDNHELRLPFWTIELFFGFILNVFLTVAVWNTKWQREIN